jgi:hypothetical protein
LFSKCLVTIILPIVWKIKCSHIHEEFSNQLGAVTKNVTNLVGLLVALYITNWDRLYDVYKYSIRSVEHRGKTSAHASTLLKSLLRTWWKCSEGCQKLKMEATRSDFDVLPFLWKCKRNNERNNLKTRNNYSSINLLLKRSLTEPYKDIFCRYIWSTFLSIINYILRSMYNFCVNYI